MDDILYIPDLVSLPEDAFTILYRELDFDQHESSPRREYYMNDHDVPYAYGSPGNQREFFPKPWHPKVMEIRQLLEAKLGVIYDVCFVNCYEHQHQHLGWHADDSPEMNDAVPITTVSLGAEREIWFRENGNRDPNHVVKMSLASGSACVMPAGFQDTHQHRIPKHSAPCGPRLSLTFRGYIDPNVGI